MPKKNGVETYEFTGSFSSLCVATIDCVSMPRARWRYFVLADSPRDGGWIRIFADGGFRTRSRAEQAITVFMPMIQSAGDYRALKIKKIIVFNRRRDFR